MTITTPLDLAMEQLESARKAESDLRTERRQLCEEQRRAGERIRLIEERLRVMHTQVVEAEAIVRSEGGNPNER